MKKCALLVLFLLTFFLGCTSSHQKKLFIYTWADFFSQEVIEEFENLYNCRVIIDTFDTNESMYTKLQYGVAYYDIITPNNYFISVLKEQGLLEKIDTANIPNAKNFDPRFFSLVDPETLKYGVIYTAATSGIAWRTDRVTIENPSWSIFSDPSFRDRMTMLNDPRELLAVGLLFLGYSINTTNPEEIRKAKELLISWKKNLATFENEQYRYALATGEHFIAHGYDGDILQTIQEHDNIAFALPKEGTAITMDLFSIPKDARNSDLAHAFINFCYTPQVAAKNMRATSYICPCIGSYESTPIKKYIKELLCQDLSHCELFKYLGKDQTLYTEAFAEIKAAK